MDKYINWTFTAIAVWTAVAVIQIMTEFNSIDLTHVF